jgi:hypothetical protein
MTSPPEPSPTIVSSVVRPSLMGVLRKTPFFKHPVAVLLSLILGTLLVILIHQNLEDQVIWRDSVTVSTRETTAHRMLVVKVPGGYFVRKLDGHLRTEIIIRGAHKDRIPKESLTISASLPIERLGDIGDSWGRVSLENGDLKIQGWSKLKCEMTPPIQVEVAALREGVIQFVPDIVDPNPLYDDVVTFTPPSALIEAPAPFFASKSRMEYTVPVRENSRELASVTIEGIRIALSEAVAIRVVRNRKPSAAEKHLLTDVPVSVTEPYVPDGQKRRFRLSVPSWPPATVNVEIDGPPRVIERYRKPGESSTTWRRSFATRNRPSRTRGIRDSR